jgi:peptide chain release factor 3
MGKRFGGVFDIRGNRMRVFRPGGDRREENDEFIEGIESLPPTPTLSDGSAPPRSGRVDDLVARFGDAFEQARHEIDLVRGASPAFDRAAFLAGRQTPVFFGSAINNFGVREVLDALIDLAPPPGPKAAMQRVVEPVEEKFTGVVFKIQANMDPAHRDRVAFVRVCSGRFVRGMQLKISRNGKELRTNNVVSFLSQRRELLEEAYPGDVIGIPNHGVLQLGDTLTEGEKLQFTGLPFFAPEMFYAVELADPLRSKQLRSGLAQLGEEGAIQVFRPHTGGALLLGAVGQLQLEVVAHRLKHEYGVDARMAPTRHRFARWITCDDARELKRFIDSNAHRIAYDVVEAPTFLAGHAPELTAAQDNWTKVRFHALREHAGLVFAE